MFIKKVGNKVILFNDSMQVISDFENATITIENSRILIQSDKNTNILCDMPLESTSILY